MKLLTLMMSAALLAGCRCDKFAQFEGYGTKVVEEAVDVNAFENGSFEAGGVPDTVLKNGEVGRFGVNGGRGLRIHPTAKNFAYVFPLKARLEKGKRYVFSADLRGHGKAWGETVMDAWFVNPRAYASGCGAWSPTFKPIADGWTHNEVDVVIKHDPDKIKYDFMIYGGVGRGGSHTNADCYIDVDNIMIRLDAPKWEISNTWPIHNLVHADEGRIRFNSSFFGSFFAPEAKPAYACELLAADGASLGREVIDANTNGLFNFTADFGALDYRGPAKVRVTLYDRAERVSRGTREFDVTVAIPERTKNLFVQENGVVLRNGKPYMPIGFYTGFGDPKVHDMKSTEHHFKILHDAGFNAIMDYSCYLLKGKRRDEFYALAEKYGLGIVDDSFGIGTDLRTPEKRAAAEKMAKEIAAHPAHIGWYTMDEAAESAIPHLSDVRRLLNRVAPGKLVNTCNIQRAAPYLPTADVQGGDSYPVNKQKSNTLMEPHGRVSKVAACEPAAIWYAPQCYNWCDRRLPADEFRKKGYEPTFEEMLSVTLCMVQDRTTGFLFYSYFDTIECPVPEYRASRWAAMVEISKILHGLEPFIMSGEKIVELPHADKFEPTRITALSDGKGATRVIVCGLERKHEATFTLPAKYGKLKSRLGHVTEKDGTYTFTGGIFSCDILE